MKYEIVISEDNMLQIFNESGVVVHSDGPWVTKEDAERWATRKIEYWNEFGFEENITND